MKLTRKKAIELFRKHWRSIARDKENNGKYTKWFEAYISKHGDINGSCFLCEYDKQQHYKYCNKTCIIQWPNCYHCLDNRSLFSKWERAKIHDKAKEIARLISELPERKEVIE